MSDLHVHFVVRAPCETAQMSRDVPICAYPDRPGLRFVPDQLLREVATALSTDHNRAPDTAAIISALSG